ncbi:MAG: T9SS type A sorting domain-containing protein [Candidatus Zhuqueibacterota bacterium]
MNSGNPVFNTGWLQDLYMKPCDLYFLQGSGPFSLAPLDTQRVVYAIIVGHGETRLESVLELKRNTNFIRDVFRNEFQMKAWTETEVRVPSQSRMEMAIRSKVETEVGTQSIQADLLTYSDSLVRTIDLYDDGTHGDALASDYIFSHALTLDALHQALYINLRIKAVSGKEYSFLHAAEDIAAIYPDVFISEIDVAADHLNNDGKINPGENVRLCFQIKNELPFPITSLNVLVLLDTALVQGNPEHFFFKNVGMNEFAEMDYDPNDESSFYELDVSPNFLAENPSNDRIDLNVKFYVNEHHIWDQKFTVSLSVQPLEHIPNLVIPAHISGYSSATFEISVIDPDQLTGHTYAITVSDSINENGDPGFNLIDQTLGDTLLKRHELPDTYAYNIPITDGFKVTRAVLPEVELSGHFESYSGDDLRPFYGISYDASLSPSMVTFGDAIPEHYCPVEIEFTNRVDSSGVVGALLGQSGFQHTVSPLHGIVGFFPCGINVWKIVNNQRAGRLNIIFQEESPSLPAYDETWTPGEWLYIMASNYDATGQLYLGLTEIPMGSLLYKMNLSLRRAESAAGIGDKLYFERCFLPTVDDMWLFSPTNILDDGNRLPTRFELYQNYPNPFNPTTTIRFSIPKQSQVSLRVYNILGQEVADLFNRIAGPGDYAVNWNGKDRFGRSVVSGIYFARFETSAGTRLIKMALIR